MRRSSTRSLIRGAARQPVLGARIARQVDAKGAVGVAKHLLAVEAVARRGILDQSAILVVDGERPPARVERKALDRDIRSPSEGAPSVVGTGREIARHGRGEGKSAAPRNMRPSVGIGMGVPFADPTTPGSHLRCGQRRTSFDHVPGRADAEHQSHHERPDEIDQGPHRMAGFFVFTPSSCLGGREHERRIWHGTRQAIGVHRCAQ